MNFEVKNLHHSSVRNSIFEISKGLAQNNIPQINKGCLIRENIIDKQS